MMASDNVQTFTDGNFDETVIKAGTPVLVDFWAPLVWALQAVGADR